MSKRSNCGLLSAVTHSLTIRYVDEDGDRVATTYRDTLEEGEAYRVGSPDVDGMLAGLLGKKREEDEDDDSENKINKKVPGRVFSLIPAIGSIVAFILTEDMSLDMVMTDKWTLLMVGILAVQIVDAVLSRKTTDDDEGEQAQA